MASISESTDVGRMVIHPIGQTAATVLSVTSLAAPNSAKKAMDKARDQEKKKQNTGCGKVPAKSSGNLSQYAAAWTELGRLQYMNKDNVNAQHSFEKALDCHLKYSRPYLGLAQIEAEAANWAKAVDLTKKLLALNSAIPPPGYSTPWPSTT